MKPLDQLPIIAEELGLDRETLIFRYLVERTLYRLGVAFPNAFVLKGGLYLGFLAGERYTPYRPTKDADLTAFGTWSTDELIAAFEALKTDNPERAQDGVWYSGKVRVKDISKGRNYNGSRIRIKAHVGPEHRLLSFDVSHGSRLAVPAMPWGFGALIRPLTPPTGIRVYPVESVISEKLHAFHTNADPGSYGRLRDVYDLAYLFSTLDLDSTEIVEAVQATFWSRLPSGPGGVVFWPTRPPTMTHLHLESHLEDEWLELVDPAGGSWFQPSLEEALNLILRFADPLLDAMAGEEPFTGQWIAGEGWQS